MGKGENQYFVGKKISKAEPSREKNMELCIHTQTAGSSIKVLGVHALFSNKTE